MPNTLFNSKTTIHNRILASLLIFALASPPQGFAQQPQQQQPPQQRILLEEDQKTNQAKPAGPRSARPELVLQTGVTAPAFNAIFSPDGRLLASMDWMAGSIKLWEVESGLELCALNLGSRSMSTSAMSSAFVFSPDSASLFSVSAGKLKQWDARSGRELRSADLNQGKDFGFACFSADARMLTTAPPNKTSLAVWDVGSGRKLQELKMDVDNDDELLAFSLSPDGRILATEIESTPGGAKHDILTLRDAVSGRITQTIKISEQKVVMGADDGIQVRSIRFSPDGRAVAVAFLDMTRDMSQVFSGGQPRVAGRVNRLRIWDASSGRALNSLDAGSINSGESNLWLRQPMPNTVALSNDNRQCAIASGNTVKLFDPSAGRNLATISGHNGEVLAVSFSADGKFLAT